MKIYFPPVGGTVVVVGGGQVGAETANHLAVHLKTVTIIEMLPLIAPAEALAPRWHLLRSLEGRKVNIMTNSKVIEITEDFVKVDKDGTILQIPADTVVLAVCSQSNNELIDSLKAAGLDATPIGDANRVAQVLEATADGYTAAIAL